MYAVSLASSHSISIFLEGLYFSLEIGHTVAQGQRRPQAQSPTALAKTLWLIQVFELPSLRKRWVGFFSKSTVQGNYFMRQKHILPHCIPGFLSQEQFIRQES